MTDLKDVNTTNKSEYARLETRAFSIVLETVGIFGIPALLVVGVSKWLAWEKGTTYIFLGVMFVLSWVFLLWRVKQVTRKLEDMRNQIKKEN